MSDIRTLYTNIAAKTVAYTNEDGDAVSVTARDLPDLKKQEFVLPVRMLLPWQSRNAGGSDLNLITVGVTNVFGTFTWRIADLFLLERAGAGYGIHDYLPDLIRYSGEYVEMIADGGRDMSLGTMTFAGLTLECGLLEWPLDSGNEFYGVEAVLVYEELINP